MFKRFWGWVKKHPLLTGLMVIVGALVIMMLTRGGSSSSQDAGAVAGAMPYDPNGAAMFAAQNQANAQMAMANIAAGVQNNQTNAALAGLKDTNASQVEIARIAAQSSNINAGYQADTAKYIANSNNAAIRDTAQINATAAVNVANLNAQTQKAIATISANALIQSNKDTNAARISIAGIQGNAMYNAARVGAMSDVIGFETGALSKIAGMFTQKQFDTYEGFQNIGAGGQKTSHSFETKSVLTGDQITGLFNSIINQANGFFKMAPQKIN
jgi:hypothetical protein